MHPTRSPRHMYCEARRELARLRRNRAKFIRKLEQRHKLGHITDAQRAEGLRVIADLADARIMNLEAFVRAAGGEPPTPRRGTATLLLAAGAALVVGTMLPGTREVILGYLALFGCLLGIMAATVVLSVAVLALTHRKRGATRQGRSEP